jgi:HlyD family secretion protein
MWKRISPLILPLLALGMLTFAVIHVVKAQHTDPKPPPPIEPARTPFNSTVAGAGIVEARTKNISIGSALPGVVLEVYVPVEDVGKTVKKGDKLFRVDDRQLQAQLATANANLAAAKAQLAKLENQPRFEERAPSQAKVASAMASVDLAEDLAGRARKLIPNGGISEEDYRQRVLSTALAKRQLEQSQADYKLLDAGAWKFDIDIAKVAVDQAEAQAKQIATDIDRCVVRAPVDGMVLQVNVLPGQFVAAPSSNDLVVLGAIDKIVYVRVDIDEHDIPRLKRGAPAEASLRGQPAIKYPMRYVRTEPYVIPKKSLTGDNTERVDTRVLQVLYALDVEDRPIFVGQQMDVFINLEGTPTKGGN